MPKGILANRLKRDEEVQNENHIEKEHYVDKLLENSSGQVSSDNTSAISTDNTTDATNSITGDTTNDNTNDKTSDVSNDATGDIDSDTTSDSTSYTISYIQSDIIKSLAKRSKYTDTHIRKTYYFDKKLFKKLDKLSSKTNKDHSYIINEALRIFFDIIENNGSK